MVDFPAFQKVFMHVEAVEYVYGRWECKYTEIWFTHHHFTTILNFRLLPTLTLQQYEFFSSLIDQIFC